MQADPLPSWDDGKSKQNILTFVNEVTSDSHPSYVPPEERIATFDNDGTLWAEKPIDCQVMFIFSRVFELEKEHPDWQGIQPFKAVLRNDTKYLENLGNPKFECQLKDLILATYSGMHQGVFQELVSTFLINTEHPRFKVKYTEVVYQPMLELLDFLRGNDFKLFICTGGGVDFVRAFSESVYGIPRENVIGASVKYEFLETDNVIFRKMEINSKNDNKSKPENIQLHIGRIPVIAVGNSDGDLQMLKYTDAGKGPSLKVLLHHDDAEREYDYDKGTKEAIRVAKEQNWTIVSIKDDFKRVFPFEKERN
ncbi:MAG: haloacid dehalogenase-like hydrolase [Candidatus Scalindua sp. AMX11]|nr:MAG: haloacid dehalogenase-like hydrolase [Candidatus Scalindua sp.]NOG82315.1 haloacid dehalogenase-like hydrolase [Planctomycetota bacterium]RZV66664.1 MAG: haloacid dehalogenase-like hydrolase [Candidatus Scalindua sp. SCAELEC01]TDE63641.1 MAG: haloacid dehalogenase-like hydrolase [Candidatus Scalindua sp. AMX11]